eukprot:CAMPEP_0115042846 /NCGR_PEP_ID=MMETSP0216-20121206/46512_1 /TAXON_ID=223996 /ORGANISM="Protocruzia adherens, Strain Boccale" /LENGTH=125 /DNA_ID=CAMNT_0002425045 /DNA_START=182 /DNA_END=555 /DNA_ORIENTATION=+
MIILDLSGNPMFKEPQARLYTIFQLKRIKVLNGVSVDQGEVVNAKDAFLGKLTDEVLYDKLNGKEVRSITELDLSYCKLRDFHNIFSESSFPALKELKLSGESLHCELDETGSPRGLNGLVGLEV